MKNSKFVEPKGWCAFEAPGELIAYLEVHADTPRALCVGTHIIMFLFLAGLQIKIYPDEQDDIVLTGLDYAVRQSDLSTFISLHRINDFAAAVDIARARVLSGEVNSLTWKEDFKKCWV